MEITVNKNGSELTISPVGRIDTSTAPQLKQTVDENISGVTDLTFDFKNLNYLSSAGLRALMSTQKIMKNQGKMKLINVNEDVMDIFDMTGLTDVFTIE
jgi:anti-sigma B factor antagonist